MRNRYLMDKASRMLGDRTRSGGSLTIRDRARERHDYNDYDYNDYNNNYDYNRGKSYGNFRDNVGYDRNHQQEFHGNRLDYGDMEMRYHEDLKRWIEKLRRKSHLNIDESQVIEMAKAHGVRFDEFDETEFYAMFLANTTDYPFLGKDPSIYIKMTKAFFDDDDIEVSPSEKLCIYYYKIVKGEE